VPAETEWLATGTDGGAVASVATSATAAAAEPGYRIDAGEHLGFLLISDCARSDPLPRRRGAPRASSSARR
jgi:hypothetical protein